MGLATPHGRYLARAQPQTHAVERSGVLDHGGIRIVQRAHARDRSGRKRGGELGREHF